MGDISQISKKAEKLAKDIKTSLDSIGNREEFKRTFLIWINNNYSQDKISGFSRVSLEKLMHYFNNFTNEYNQEYLLDDTFVFENEKKVIKAIRFIQLAKEYQKNKDEIILELSESKFWFLYFLTIGAVEKGYPKLGRGILKIKENEATLKIPDENPVNDYQGNYAQINSHVGFLDLDTLEDDENNQSRLVKKLHIKINFGTLDDDIIIGSYNTYDKRIYTGALILERIKDCSLLSEEERLNEKVAFLSHKENRDEFLKVDPSIKTYLSSKLKNIRQAPSMIVQNTEGLELFLSNNRNKAPNEEDIENRFLELDKPILYVAAPETSFSDEKESQNLHSLVKHVCVYVKKNFKHVEVCTEGDFLKDPVKTRPLKTIEYLEKSRYFILLLPKTSQLSYSTIQLGWALKSSKKILFIYQENTVSERLEQLSYINKNFMPKKGDFKTDNGRSKILKTIHEFLEYS